MDLILISVGIVFLYFFIKSRQEQNDELEQNQHAVKETDAEEERFNSAERRVDAAVHFAMELVVRNVYSPKAKDALLARFKNGQIISDIAEYWDEKLGESRVEVVNNFLEEGLIEPMKNENKLDFVYSLAQLKDMCKNLNLKVSGRKIEVAERLLLADRRRVEALVADLEIMCLTKAGAEIVLSFFRRQAEEYEFARTEIMQHLEDGNLTDSIEVSLRYKSNMLWPSGSNERFDLNFLSGVLASRLGNKEERFQAALLHLLPKP